MLVENDNSVCVWLGNLTPHEFAEYIDREEISRATPLNPFAVDMHDYFYDRELLTGNLVPDPISIEALLHPLAFSPSYCHAVHAAAEQMGIQSANCVVALLRHELRIEQWPATSPLDFVGNFELAHCEENRAP